MGRVEPMKLLVISTEEKEHPVEARHQRMIERAGGDLCYVENQQEFARKAPKAVVVLNASFPLSAERLALLQECRLIARYGTGVDNIDIEAATRLGIPVSNVPEFCSSQVANHTIALLLVCATRLKRLDACVRTGEWDVRTSHFSENVDKQTYNC